MADAIAVVVAGAGATTAKEVFDLLEDALGDNAGFEEVALVVPVSKTLLTDSVVNALDWWDDDPSAIGVAVDGEANARRAKSVSEGEHEKVAKFEDIFSDEFDGFDVVEFYVALSDPDEDPDSYDQEVLWVEAAIAAGRKVKNLTGGLDDVVLDDPEAAAEEPEVVPEPEPEAPKRRRGRKAAAEPEVEPEADPEPEPDVEPEAGRSSRTRKSKAVEEILAERDAEPDPMSVDDDDQASEALQGQLLNVLAFVQDASRYFRAQAEINQAWYEHDLSSAPIIRSAQGAREALEAILHAGGEPAVQEVTEEAAEPAEAKQDTEEGTKRGRGRPRTNFEIKEIFDEDEDKWIPRPRGRIAKGTSWRVRHAETDEILDEGETK